MIRLFLSVDNARDSIPENSIKLLIINGRKYAIARQGENFYAFDNSCPHQHESLHKGSMTRYQEVVCPLHFYRFSLVTGRESQNRCKDLFTYPVVINPDGIYLKL